jgi:FkbM family methyltransferase
MRAVQTALLWAYRGVRHTGLLDTAPGRAVFERAYWSYKALVEAREVEALRSLVPAGSAVVDVGANIGFFTMRFAEWVGPSGRVFAIEPESANFASLAARVKSHGFAERVALVKAAAMDSAGEAHLWINPDNPADHRIADSGASVEAVKIDQLLESHPGMKVSLIKVDVQGAELRALRGAASTLERMRPALLVEFHEPSLVAAGTTPRELLAYLTGFGYAPSVLAGDGAWQALTGEELFERMSARGYVDALLRCP